MKNDISKKLAKLTPEQRALLEKKLREKSAKRKNNNSISVRENLSEYPMSSAQKRLWFLDQLNKGSAFYNIPSALKLTGKLNIKVLEQSIKKVLERHQVLNVVFRVEDNQPVQKLKAYDFSLEINNVETLNKFDIQKLINDEATKPFNLSEGPLFRAKLLTINDNNNILLITLHHIVADGWSVGILIKEVTQLYDSLLKNNKDILAPLKIQYFDYANWSESNFSTKNEEKHIAFWKEALSGMPQILNLPLDKPRPRVQTFNGDRVSFKVPKELANKIKIIGKESAVTPFLTYLSVFEILLYRYSLQEDFGIGTLISDRQKKETRDLIGFFVNTLVMRAQLNPNLNFRTLLKQVKEFAINAFEYQSLQFDKLVDNILEERNTSSSPLFQVMFDYQESPLKNIKLEDISFEIINPEMKITKFELLLILEESPAGVTGVFEFNTDLYNRKTIKRFADSYLELLKSISVSPEKPIDKLSILNKTEEERLIKKMNTVVSSYPKKYCLHQLFEQQAKIFPENVAIEFNNIGLSYLELNKRSNKLARYLINKGVKKGELIAVHLERNNNLIISILAILKAGGAYLPMDPMYPKDRLNFMLSDSKVKILITEKKYDGGYLQDTLETIIVDEDNSAIEKESSDNVVLDITPDQTAYVIYTSGSTGKPKGTIISHYNVVRLFQSSKTIFDFNSNDVWTLFHSYSFDFSVWEIWGALIYGGKLIIVPSEITKSPSEFYNLLVQKNVTVLNQTPVAFFQLSNIEESRKAEELVSSLKYIIFGGEALDFNQLKPWIKNHGYKSPTLINMYGITETTVHVTYKVITENDIINSNNHSIGNPLPDLQLYILDNNLTPQQIGVPGEICVSGAGLAKGYLFRDTLTKQKFIDNPFCKNSKLYRSGDLGRFIDNGEVEYLGRIDKQIKLRGFRIELGEIEKVLSQLPEIKKSVVLLHGETEINKKLVAFYIKNDNSFIQENKIKKDISSKLPDYMIPSQFIEISEIPITNNGKLDRKYLLNKIKNAKRITQSNYIPPRNKLEKYLKEHWENILEIEKIGIHDDFFKVGGNSIQAAILANNLQNDFNEIFHVGTIFFTPTIYEIAKHLNSYFNIKVKEIFGEDFSEYYLEKSNVDYANFKPIDNSHIKLFNSFIPKLTPRNKAHITKKNKKAIFILSPPRSGSTLFRIMMAGNSQIFAPPELELMSFSTMQERNQAFKNEFNSLKDGTVKAIMELKSVSENEAVEFIKQFEDSDLTIQQFYGILQNLIGDKILVDKTPVYSLNKEILNRIEEDFDEPLFIHLIRHPYASIYSFIESKMSSFVFRQELPFDIREIAELVWYTCHNNIIDFLKTIPNERQLQLKFEDIVLNPEKNMKAVSDFIGIEYDEKMIMPYNSERMTTGVNTLVPMVGDLKFYMHKSINPEVLDKWKEKHKFDFLSAPSKSLAENFNYETKFYSNYSLVEPTSKLSKLELYLIKLWEDILKVSNISVHDDFFDLGGNSLLAAVFTNRLQKDFKVEVQVQSIFLAPTISEFSHYAKEYYPEIISNKFGEDVKTVTKDYNINSSKKITEEDILKFNDTITSLADFNEEIKEKNPSAIFILSPPRSGSTLLRVMLEGHEKLFSPPELDLLSFNTLKERKEKLSSNYSLWLEATIRAIMELKNCNVDEAKNIMNNYESEDISIKDFYNKLQNWAGNRILVDKTPTYALDKNILQRIEKYFENPLYIHLTRNPYASIYSFIEAELDKNFFRYEHSFNRRELAELIWMFSHQNIIEFLQHVPKERQIRIKFEDLINDTENEMIRLSGFLGIEYKENLIQPYQGKRMTDPINQNSQMVGDFKFYLRNKIDPNVTQRWKNYHKVDFLSDTAIKLAKNLDYQLSVKSITKESNYQRIEKIPRDKHIPLSFSQQRLWFLDQLDPGKSTYNIPGVVKLKGNLNIKVLEKSINEIVKRHESLRTLFLSDDGKARVHILSDLKINLKVYDLTELNEKQKEKQSNELIVELSKKGFNLSEGPLIRCNLLKLNENNYILIITTHHIISDGWSSEIFVKELAILYKTFVNGKNSPLSKLPIDYVDYATWQRKWLESGIYDSQINFWKNKLENAPSLLDLPTDFPRPGIQKQNGKRIQFELDEKLIEKLIEIGVRENATIYILLLTAFNILLYKYSHSEDILVGTPVAGRNRNEIEPIIGLFVNTLVIRTDLSNNPTFKQLVQRVKEIFVETLNHQDVPFEKLVDELNIERSLSHSPLFQVMFVFNNSPLSKIEIEELSIEPIALDLGAAKFDITFVLTKRGNRIRGSLEYDTDLFRKETIERMISHFQGILEVVVKNSNKKIQEIDLLTPIEKQTLLNNSGKIENTWQKYKSVSQIISNQAKQTPQQIALVFKDKEITYFELEEKSNQIANYLVKQGVKKDELVPICLERSFEMLYGLLGILKAGAAYLPIDPTNPIERISYIIQDSNAKIVLSSSPFISNFQQNDLKVLLLDDYEEIKNISTNSPNISLEHNNTMYCIYTSGSTGKPKGTLVPNKGVLNRLLWMKDEYEIDKSDIILQKTPYTFDVSVWELFLALMSGGTLVIAKPEGHKDSNYIKNIINKQRITTIHFVPPMLQVFLEEENLQENCKSLKRVICSGETLSYNLQTKFFNKFKSIQLHNLYGPTEASIDVSSWVCNLESDLQTVPIGKPIWNTSLYILDQNLNPVPRGVVGELYIGGISLAHGYLNRPDLTAEKFIPDPYSNIVNSRMYKTGDAVKLLPNNSIEFIERLDNQVKIRGFRIELGEIEKVLNSNELISKSLVIAIDNEIGGKKLVAYLVADKSKITITDLREYIKEYLPEYMVPASFVFLDEFPLTPNGKINRKALPKPEITREDVSTEFIAPSTEKEIILADIVKELLKIEKIGVEDNFFELGGDSIVGIQLIAKANQAGLRLTPKDLFLYPNIRSLASISRETIKIYAEQETLSGEVLLTPIQKWFFELKLQNQNQWNQSILLDVNEPLDEELFKNTIIKLIEHHDALRMKYVSLDGKITQTYVDKLEEIPFEVIDLSKTKESDKSKVISEKSNAAQASLNLAKGKVFKCVYFYLGENTSGRLLIIAHHLVIDGVSWRILTEDLFTIYEQLKLNIKPVIPLKTTSFAYWAKNISEFAESKFADEEIEYWKNIKLLQDPIKSNGIDHSKNIEKSIDKISIFLEEQLTETLLQKVPKIYNTEINEVLLTALILANARWKGSRKMSIALEGHGRESLFEDIDTSRTIGWFTSLYPIVLDLQNSITPSDSLKTIKESLRKIPNNGIGYGIIKYFSKKVSRSDLPHLPEISFNYLGQFNQNVGKQGDFKIAKENKGYERAVNNLRPFAIDIVGSVFEGKLQMSWIYSKNIHSKEDIIGFSELYKDELIKIIETIKSDEGGYTPSDFQDVDLDEEELGSIFSELDEDFEDE